MGLCVFTQVRSAFAVFLRSFYDGPAVSSYRCAAVLLQYIARIDVRWWHACVLYVLRACAPGVPGFNLLIIGGKICFHVDSNDRMDAAVAADAAAAAVAVAKG